MIATEHPDRVAERYFLADKSLVLYLPLWKRDGGGFPSDDVYGHFCTNYGSLWTPQGRSFDGSDDYVDAGSGTSLNITDAITIEAWVNLANIVVSRNIIAKGNYYVIGHPWAIQYQTDDTLIFGIEQTGVVGGIYPGGLKGSWHYIVPTFNKDLPSLQMKLYIDGVLWKTGTSTSAIPVTADTVRIGSGINVVYFNGLIGEVRIYNRALDDLEVQRSYELTKWRYR